MLGGAGQCQGDKAEHPTGRTTCRPWPGPRRAERLDPKEAVSAVVELKRNFEALLRY